ncbi:hypothetical protein L873DRAFT_1687910 [Choiromyces venosus 120613-1]|uniref:Uncharacterized protein n=1 Tax=Choiromyces venosus 120613-1 TaxID=1336337 RepID=A0A3N4JJF3_9PEZI|nr:hypothetical protein L873DRAFT_1687910 [Choiromyces venosus 120613-1]
MHHQRLFQSLLFPLLWATLATTQKLNENTFKLKESSYNPYITPLSQLLPKASVLDVLASTNHDLVAEDVRAIGMNYKATRWENSASFNDFGTTSWYPQGISTSADAYDAGTYEGKHVTLVSWYDARDVPTAENKGVRIAFVDRDKSPDAYRYVLLVEPYDNAGSVDFRSVKVHAGGIAWYGNSLYVVDTSRGFRVFDLTQIWKVESGDGIGRKAGGGFSAAGYAYVLPQSRTYTATDPPTPSLRFSFVSLDRTTTPDSLLIGEYQTASDPEPRRFVRWSIDYTNRQLVTDSAGVATATWAYQVNIDRMQGVNSINGKFYISRSNGGSNGDLITWVPGNLAKIAAGAAPEGPEDLSYDKTSGLMYTVTEPVNGRYILPFDPTVLP